MAHEPSEEDYRLRCFSRRVEQLAKERQELVESQKGAPIWIRSLLQTQAEVYQRQAERLTGHSFELNQIHLDALNRAIDLINAGFGIEAEKKG